MCFVEGDQLVGADRVGFLRDLSGVWLALSGEKSIEKRTVI